MLISSFHPAVAIEITLSRPLLAVLGCMKWIRILYFLRGFQTLRLGVRILPILGALGEQASFVLVLLFFLGAYANASYALSDEGWAPIWFSSYSVGFLGEFDKASDVLFVGEGEEL